MISSDAFFQILMGFADVAKGLISVGEGFVALAEKVVDFANDFLSFVNNIVQAGLSVFQQMAEWASKNLFKIDLLELRGSLDDDFNACVGITAKCVILGLKIDYEGNDNLSKKYF